MFSRDGRSVFYAANARLYRFVLSSGATTTIADSTFSCGVEVEGGKILYARLGKPVVANADGSGIRPLLSAMDDSLVAFVIPAQALPRHQALIMAAPQHATRADTINRPAIVNLRTGALTWVEQRLMTPRYVDGYMIGVTSAGLAAAPFSLRSHTFTGPVIQLTQERAYDPAATSQTIAYMYGSARGFHSTLVAVDAQGRERRLAGLDSGARTGTPLDTARYGWPRLSPDGKRAVLEMQTNNSMWDIWVYDIASSTLSRLTTGFHGVRPAGWTSDGKSVYYIAHDLPGMRIRGPRRVVAQRWDATEPPRELFRIDSLPFDVSVGPPHTVAALMVRSPQFVWGDIWVVPLDTPSARRPLIATAAEESQPRLSPDGKLLAYCSDETGRHEVYVVSLDRRMQRIQVSTSVGVDPMWSADGRFLYYRSTEHMMRATISRENGLSVIRRDTLFRDVYEHREVADYDVFPGGNEFLMVRQNADRLRMGVLLNWREAMRR